MFSLTSVESVRFCMPLQLGILCCSLFLLTHLSGSDAVVKIIEPPKKEVFVRSGDKAEIVWDYTVDDRNDLSFRAFVWSVAIPPYSSTKKTIKQELNTGVKQVGADIPDFLKGRSDVTGRATLEITSVNLNDSNTYFFNVGALSGSVESAINLTVVEPPQASIPKDKQLVIVDGGEERTITCKITGAPTPAVRWTRWGQNETLASTEVPVRVGVYSNLTIFGDVEKAGEYICSGSSPLGETSNASAYFIVKYFTAPSSVSLSCSMKSLCCPALGIPRPNYLWTFPNGTFLNKTRCLSSESVEYGSYICQASSSVGNAKTSVTYCSPTLSDDNPLLEGNKVTVRWNKTKGPEKSVAYFISAREDEVIYYRGTGKNEWALLDYNNLDENPGRKVLNLDVEVQALSIVEGTTHVIHQQKVRLGPKSSALGRQQAGLIGIAAPLLVAFLTVGFQ